MPKMNKGQIEADARMYIYNQTRRIMDRPMDKLLEIFAASEYFEKPKNRRKVAGMVASYVSLHFKLDPQSRRYQKGRRESWY